MLTVTRKTKESVIVGDVEITILRAREGEVKLGIVHPASTPVYLRSVPTDGRSELRRENVGERIYP